MRVFIAALSMLLLFPLTAVSQQHNKEEVGKRVTKKYCTLLGDYPDKGINEISAVMLQNAKRSALSEIYEQMIYPTTAAGGFQLTSDIISDKSLGIIKIEGDPKYYNGPNFGEVCVDITAYITKPDLEMFKKKDINIKNYCFNNPDVPLKSIRNEARKASYIEIVSKYNPLLKDIDIEQASRLVHDFDILSEELDLNTSAYCMDIKASVIPFELKFASTGRDKESAITKKSYKPGDIVFDFDLEKYAEGDPLSDISNNAMILRGRRTGKLHIGTKFEGDDEITFKNIVFPSNFILYLDCYMYNKGKVEIKLIDSKNNKELSFRIDRSEWTIEFPDNKIVSHEIYQHKWYTLKFLYKNDVVKLFAKRENKKEYTLWGAIINRENNINLDGLVLSLNTKVAYRNISITAD